MTDTTRPGSPTVAEIAALTARLRDLSRPGREVDGAERAAFLADEQALLDRLAANGSSSARRRDAAFAAAAAEDAVRDVAQAQAENGGYVLVGPSARTWRVDPAGRPLEPASEAEHRAVRELLGRDQLEASDPAWTTTADGDTDIVCTVIPAPTYEIDETDTGASSRAGDPEWDRREQLTRWHHDESAEAATDDADAVLDADDGAEVSG